MGRPQELSSRGSAGEGDACLLEAWIPGHKPSATWASQLRE
jgi:hypothetical protein